jgi:hypothetical protein
VSGEFAPNRLPVAVGVGADHAVGAVPDPGAEGHIRDYLGRDMTYHPIMTSQAIQPVLPDPTINILNYPDQTHANVNVTETVGGTNLFHRETTTDTFAEIVLQPIAVLVGNTISVYAAKIGWNNSNIISYKIPPHP